MPYSIRGILTKVLSLEFGRVTLNWLFLDLEKHGIKPDCNILVSLSHLPDSSNSNSIGRIHGAAPV